MKKSAIKIGALGASVLLATSLASCSSETEEPTTPSDGAGEVSGTVMFPAMYWAETGKDWEQLWIDTFKDAYPGVEVTQVPVPFSEYHNKMYTDMAAGQAPDIVLPYDPEIGHWINEGLLEPLDECIAEYGIDTSSFLPAQKVAERDGKTYALVLESNPRVLVYNQQLFSSKPTNLEEFKTEISNATDASTQQFGFGTVTGPDSPSATYLDLMPVIAGFGGAFVADGKPTADSAEVVAALDFLKELYDNNYVARGQNQAAYREAFAAGKTASVAIGGFIFAMVNGKNPEVGAELQAATLPLPGGGKTVSVTVYIGIPKDAKNKDAACAVIATSLKQELQAVKSRMSRSIPATGYVDPAFIEETPYFQAILDAAGMAVSYAPQGAEQHTAEVARIVTDGYQEMLATSMTGEEAAAKIQERLEALLGT